MKLEELKETMLGTWVSIAPEVRPSKNPDGTLKPFYLTRSFVYLTQDRFELTVTNYADPFGKAALAKIAIGGHMIWQGDHPIASGAHKVDFIADLLKKVAADGYEAWEVGRQQSIFGKSFRPFGLVQGQNFKEYDLVYVAHSMLFWGARNVDGRGFDTEANRPTNLQIPLVRAVP